MRRVPILTWNRMRMAAAVLCAALGVCRAMADEPAMDWDRARGLLTQERRGETLSPADRDDLDRAKRLRSQAQERQRIAAQPPSTNRTGLIPISELTGEARYRGFEGGLYGKGANEPPDAQAARAGRAMGAIRPLDAEGNPAERGAIVLLSAGMSNTTQEFAAFKRLALSDSGVNPSVLIVDGAQGGKDAADWVDVGGPGGERVWEEVERRIRAEGATPAQVQAMWVKQALKAPAALGEFPAHAQRLERALRALTVLAKARFPNLRLVFLSSRTYGGYATTPLNPEPFAYESGFSVRWLIEAQMSGDPELNADPEAGPVRAPVLLWGPYLWADGTAGRRDGLVWQSGDMAADGTHPSEAGRAKVAESLLGFFKTDRFCRPWFAGAAGGGGE